VEAVKAAPVLTAFFHQTVLGAALKAVLLVTAKSAGPAPTNGGIALKVNALTVQLAVLHAHQEYAKDASQATISQGRLVLHADLNVLLVTQTLPVAHVSVATSTLQPVLVSPARISVMDVLMELAQAAFCHQIA